MYVIQTQRSTVHKNDSVSCFILLLLFLHCQNHISFLCLMHLLMCNIRYLMCVIFVFLLSLHICLWHTQWGRALPPNKHCIMLICLWKSKTPNFTQPPGMPFISLNSSYIFKSERTDYNSMKIIMQYYYINCTGKTHRFLWFIDESFGRYFFPNLCFLQA